VSHVASRNEEEVARCACLAMAQMALPDSTKRGPAIVPKLFGRGNAG